MLVSVANRWGADLTFLCSRQLFTFVFYFSHKKEKKNDVNAKRGSREFMGTFLSFLEKCDMEEEVNQDNPASSSLQMTEGRVTQAFVAQETRNRWVEREERSQ